MHDGKPRGRIEDVRLGQRVIAYQIEGRHVLGFKVADRHRGRRGCRGVGDVDLINLDNIVAVERRIESRIRPKPNTLGTALKYEGETDSFNQGIWKYPGDIGRGCFERICR